MWVWWSYSHFKVGDDKRKSRNPTLWNSSNGLTHSEWKHTFTMMYQQSFIYCRFHGSSRDAQLCWTQWQLPACFIRLGSEPIWHLCDTQGCEGGGMMGARPPRVWSSWYVCGECRRRYYQQYLTIRIIFTGWFGTDWLLVHVLEPVLSWLPSLPDGKPVVVMNNVYVICLNVRIVFP